MQHFLLKILHINFKYFKEFLKNFKLNLKFTLQINKCLFKVFGTTDCDAFSTYDIIFFRLLQKFSFKHIQKYSFIHSFIHFPKHHSST